MFVAGEVLVDLSFPAAAARLANLARGRPLTRVSEGTYGDCLTGLVWVGPVGAVPGVSKLVEVHFLEVATRGESAVLALRGEATGPGGRLFPALDAEMSLTPAGSIPPSYRWAGSTGLRSLPWARTSTGRSFTRWRTRRSGPCWPASRTFSARPRSRPAPCREPTGPGPLRAGQRPKCPSPAALRGADQAAGDRTRRS